jgi:hypothetical protein
VAAAPAARSPRNPSGRRFRPWLRTREGRTVFLFLLCTLTLVGAWGVGITWRARIDETPYRIIADPGLPLVFSRGLESLAEILLVVTLAFAGYLGCLWALRRGFRHSFAAAIAASAIAGAVLVPASTLTSPDVTHLAADVRTLWLYERYPGYFRNAPARIAEQENDPIAAQVIDFAPNPSGYGPVAYAVGGIALPFVGDNFPANIAGQKAVAALFILLAAVAAGMVAKQLGRNPGLATGFVGLNPLMHWEFAANGHNDSIMAAFGVAALYFVLRGRPDPEPGLAPARTSLREMLPGYPSKHTINVVLVAGIVAMLVVAGLAVAGARPSRALAGGIAAGGGLLYVAHLGRPGWKARVAACFFGAASVLSKFALAPAAPLVAAWQFPRLRLVIAVLFAAAGLFFVYALANGEIREAAVGPANAVTVNPWSILWDAIGRENIGRDWITGLAFMTFVVISVVIILTQPLSTRADLTAALGILLFLFLFIGYAGYRPWYQVWFLPFAILAGRRWLSVSAVMFTMGGFLLILVRNFGREVVVDMGINDPLRKAVIFTWASIAITALVVWWLDRPRSFERAAAPARTRPPRLTPRRRPAR